MTSIGIIGAGVGGLHLALHLQQRDVDVTLYAEKSPEQQLEGRLPNTAVHWGPTRERERLLGVNHWDDQVADWSVQNVHFHGSFGPLTKSFTAAVDAPGAGIDPRIYTSTLLADFLSRGGDAVYGSVQLADLESASEIHDLVVVSSGRGAMTELFERRPDGRPFAQPQRFICTGIYDGIAAEEPVGSSINVIPGSGELFQLPFLTFGGQKTVLLFEVIPGGVLDRLRTVRYDEDPREFETTILQILETSFPHTRGLVDEANFGIARPGDVLQGAITPTARQGYARLGNGKHVMALGDVHVVNDPVLAQGANSASASAFLLGDAILDDHLAFDELWCARAESRLWANQSEAFQWTNFMLRNPLPGNAAKLILAACDHPAVAHAFINNYEAPRHNWNILASDARTNAFLDRHGVIDAADGPPVAMASAAGGGGGGAS